MPVLDSIKAALTDHLQTLIQKLVLVHLVAMLLQGIQGLAIVN